MAGVPVMYIEADDVTTACAMLWGGVHSDGDVYPDAGEVKDFRMWGVACHSEGDTTLVTDDYGSLEPGQFLAKHYVTTMEAGDIASVTVEDQATIETWRFMNRDPDGWQDYEAFAAFGGDPDRTGV